jgi:hypothetical protein
MPRDVLDELLAQDSGGEDIPQAPQPPPPPAERVAPRDVLDDLLGTQKQPQPIPREEHHPDVADDLLPPEPSSARPAMGIRPEDVQLRREPAPTPAPSPAATPTGGIALGPNLGVESPDWKPTGAVQHPMGLPSAPVIPTSDLALATSGSEYSGTKLEPGTDELDWFSYLILKPVSAVESVVASVAKSGPELLGGIAESDLLARRGEVAAGAGGQEPAMEIDKNLLAIRDWARELYNPPVTEMVRKSEAATYQRRMWENHPVRAQLGKVGVSATDTAMFMLMLMYGNKAFPGAAAAPQGAAWAAPGATGGEAMLKTMLEGALVTDGDAAERIRGGVTMAMLSMVPKGVAKVPTDNRVAQFGLAMAANMGVNSKAYWDAWNSGETATEKIGNVATLLAGDAVMNVLTPKAVRDIRKADSVRKAAAALRGQKPVPAAPEPPPPPPAPAAPAEEAPGVTRGAGAPPAGPQTPRQRASLDWAIRSAARKQLAQLDARAESISGALKGAKTDRARKRYEANLAKIEVDRRAIHDQLAALGPKGELELKEEKELGLKGVVPPELKPAPPAPPPAQDLRDPRAEAIASSLKDASAVIQRAGKAREALAMQGKREAALRAAMLLEPGDIIREQGAEDLVVLKKDSKGNLYFTGHKGKLSAKTVSSMFMQSSKGGAPATIVPAKGIVAQAEMKPQEPGKAAERPPTPEEREADREPIEIRFGAKGVVTHPSDPHTKHSVRYGLAALDSVQGSLDVEGRQNPLHNAQKQPRNRNTLLAGHQIDGIAANPDPHRLFDVSPFTDNGPTISDAVGDSLSGTARITALKRIRKSNPAKWAELQKYIRDNIAQYGLTEADYDAMKDRDPIPVALAEDIRTLEQKRAFAELANVGSGAEMSRQEKASIIGAKITPQMVASLRIPEGGAGKIEDVINANPEFVASIIQTIPKSQWPALVTGDGRALSAEGVERVVEAMMAKVLPGEAGQRLQRLFTEKATTNIESVRNGLVNALPKIARASALIESGQRAQGLDIMPDIAAAIEKLHELRRPGQPPVDVYLGQRQMFGELSPFQKQLLSFLDQAGKGKGSCVRELFEKWASAVEAGASENQVDMFADGSRYAATDIIEGIMRQAAADGTYHPEVIIRPDAPAPGQSRIELVQQAIREHGLQSKALEWLKERGVTGLTLQDLKSLEPQVKGGATGNAADRFAEAIGRVLDRAPGTTRPNERAVKMVTERGIEDLVTVDPRNLAGRGVELVRKEAKKIVNLWHSWMLVHDVLRADNVHGGAQVADRVRKGHMKMTAWATEVERLGDRLRVLLKEKGLDIPEATKRMWDAEVSGIHPKGLPPKEQEFVDIVRRLYKMRQSVQTREVLASKMGVRQRFQQKLYECEYTTSDGKTRREMLTENQYNNLRSKNASVAVIAEKDRYIISSIDWRTGKYVRERLDVSNYDEVRQALATRTKKLMGEMFPFAEYLAHERAPKDGDYWVTLYELDSATGEEKKIAASVFSTKIEADAVARGFASPGNQMLRAEVKAHDARQKSFPLPVSMSHLTAALQRIGVDPETSEAGAKIVSAFRSMSGFYGKTIHREPGLKGHEIKPEAIVDSAVRSGREAVSRLSRNDYAAIMPDVEKIQDKFIHDAAQTYVLQLCEPVENSQLDTALSAVKRYVYYSKLANSISYGLQNVTERGLSAACAAKYEPNWKKVGEILKSELRPEYEAQMKRAEADGLVKPFYKEEMTASTRLLRADVIGRTTETGSGVYAFRTGLRIAQAKGMTPQQAYDFAHNFLFESKPLYLDPNSPIFTQKFRKTNKYGMIFLKWQIDQLGKFWLSAESGKKGGISKAGMTLAMYYALTGLNGVPLGHYIASHAGLPATKKPTDDLNLADRILLDGVMGGLGLGSGFITLGLTRPLTQGWARGTGGSGAGLDVMRGPEMIATDVAKVNAEFSKKRSRGEWGIVGAASRMPLLGAQQLIRGYRASSEGTRYGKHKYDVYYPTSWLEKAWTAVGMTTSQLAELRRRETDEGRDRMLGLRR